MLLNLSIRDIVLIDRLDLDIRPGLSVLTGETGAGKSILLDAFGLALGGRADLQLLRPGATQAVVAAEFALAADHPVRALLDEQGLTAEGNLILRRQLGADGRSRAFVNDQAVGIGLLRRIGEMLVEIEGQFEQQRLLDAAHHRALLDAFGGLAGQAARVRDSWRGWRAAAAARAEAESALAQARRDEDYLRHAVAELQDIDPKPGEEAERADSRRLLSNREMLLVGARAAFDELTGERGADARVMAAQRRLDRIADKAGELAAPVVAALDRAAAELADAADRLRRMVNDPELAPHRLAQIEERLFALRDLARKHGVPVDALADHAARLAAQLAAIDDQGGRLAQLTRDEAAARQSYLDAADALSTARAEAARRLDAAINTELPPLKLDKARFATRLERLAESDWGENGLERVVFEVATNPGMPPGALNRIASGGELSRFLLALKVVLAEADPVPTLVFDEVDSGVGGATAAAVGDRLARLGRKLQVLVVTHSPQVAARTDQHWRVEKAAVGKSVVTRLAVLDAHGRREEIARMLSGASVTDEARAAADRLMTAAPAARRARSPGRARG
ncbi:MAG: DNA repair protein RecN [Dongiaceae bacterium]